MARLQEKSGAHGEAREGHGLVDHLTEAGHANASVGWLVSAIAVLPSVLWIWLDKRVWPWDQALYGEVSAQLYEALRTGPGQWLATMTAVLPTKPPLAPWLGQFFMPIGTALGDYDFALLLSIVLTQAAALACVYLLVRSLVPEARAWAIAAVLLTGSAPLFIGLNHQYMVEPVQTLVVAASFLLAARSASIPILRGVALLVLLGAAGAAAKSTTPLYCGFAWAIAAIVFATRLLRRERVGWSDGAGLVLGVMALALLSLTALWYRQNLAAVLEHARLSTEGETALQYGSIGSLWEKLVFWLRASGEVSYVSPVALVGAGVLIAIGAVAAIWRALRGTAGSGAALRTVVGLAALAHVGATLLVLATQINQETRFLEPIIPLLAVALVFFLSRFAHRLVAIAAVVLAGLQLVLVHAQALGIGPALAQSPWLLPLQTDPADRQVIAEIADRTCPKELQNRYIVVVIEYPQMNANSMSMYSARQQLKKGWRCYYTSLGYAETDIERAFARIADLDTAYVVTPVSAELPKKADVFNMITTAAYARIAASPEYVRDGEPVGKYQIWRRLPERPRP